MLRFVAALAALTAAACVVAPLTMGGEGFPADNLVARTVLFYVVTIVLLCRWRPSIGPAMPKASWAERRAAPRVERDCARARGPSPGR